MSHPITQNIRYLAGYFGIWLVFALVQSGILYYALSLSLYELIIDALLFNFLLGIIGLAIWPLVNFSSLEGTQLVNTLITHLAGAALLISVVVFTTYSVLSYLLAKNGVYLNFLEGSLFYRVALAAIIYVLMALNYYVIIYNQEFKVRRINEAELKQSLKETELEMLKSQLNPHFIFNSLNSISSLTITNPEKAQEMVISLSEFLRYAIKPTQDKLIKLGNELEAINQFISIEKVRFEDRITVSIDAPYLCKKLFLPPLIIQPLVENAIKFGVHETLDKGIITITCTCSQNLLKIIVKNTFDKKNTAPEKTGIGLKNVADRLKLMYGVNDLLKVSKENSTFTVQLLIPQNI